MNMSASVGVRPGSARFPANPDPARVIETTVSPFHCLYQDAFDFHNQSRLMLNRSTSGASRLARASLLLYVGSAEALVHQAAAELARPELAAVVADPERPLPLIDACRLLPAILGGAPANLEVPPWPQLAELFALRDAWAYPGRPEERRAYYQAPRVDSDFEPLQPHQVTPGIAAQVPLERLVFPRTGLPRDPYALRPAHLDTVRAILDSAVEALDRLLQGALTRDNRHRKEPVRLIPT